MELTTIEHRRRAHSRVYPGKESIVDPALVEGRVRPAVDELIKTNSQLLIPPLIRPVNANIAYRTAFDVSERDTFCVPPAPKLETALYMPVVAKLRCIQHYFPTLI